MKILTFSQFVYFGKRVFFSIIVFYIYIIIFSCFHGSIFLFVLDHATLEKDVKNKSALIKTLKGFFSLYLYNVLFF